MGGTCKDFYSFIYFVASENLNFAHPGLIIIILYKFCGVIFRWSENYCGKVW